MCSGQGSEMPADLIKFDKVFIIATLHSIINFQGKQSRSVFFNLDQTLQSPKVFMKTKQNKNTHND